MIEAFFSIVSSGFMGFIFMEIRELRNQLNKIENDVLVLKLLAPKRRTDSEYVD